MTPLDPKAIRFVAFSGGEPIGMQTLDVTLPEVRTATWLGRASRGTGLETEMRTAVLAFAFAHLGAEVARSDADPELRRRRFRPAVEVEVAGPLAALLPLVGA